MSYLDRLSRENDPPEDQKADVLPAVKKYAETKKILDHFEQSFKNI